MVLLERQEALPEDRHGREELLEGRKVLPEGREWSGGPLRGPRVVGRPFRRAGSGRETFPESQEWSGGPPRGPLVIKRHSQKDRRPSQRARRG